MSAPQLAVAMDWGGTWIRTALINKQGRILWQDREPNPPNGTKEEYLGNAQDLLTEPQWLDRWNPLPARSFNHRT